MSYPIFVSVINTHYCHENKILFTPCLLSSTHCHSTGRSTKQTIRTQIKEGNAKAREANEKSARAKAYSLFPGRNE